VEFAMNSAVNVATGVSPFEFVFGKKPRLFPITGNLESIGTDVSKWIEDRQAAWASYRDKLWTNRISQAIHYNSRRGNGEVLEKGDWVLIDSKDRQQVVGGDGRPTSKLRPRYDGPYKVLEGMNGGRNFRLKLDENDKSHDVFHISKLKKYRWREEECDKEVSK
jgi:hypothetical protein